MTSKSPRAEIRMDALGFGGRSASAAPGAVGTSILETHLAGEFNVFFGCFLVVFHVCLDFCSGVSWFLDVFSGFG